MILDKVDHMRSHNVEETIFICLKSGSKSLGIFNDFLILQGIPKQYDFPTQKELHQLIDPSKIPPNSLPIHVCSS